MDHVKIHVEIESRNLKSFWDKNICLAINDISNFYFPGAYCAIHYLQGEEGAVVLGIDNVGYLVQIRMVMHQLRYFKQRIYMGSFNSVSPSIT
jgi:hypothetical protein